MEWETIILQVKIGGKWFDRVIVDDLHIKAYKITPAQVMEYAQAHPSPLDILFKPPPQYRVVYHIEQDYGQFAMRSASE